MISGALGRFAAAITVVFFVLVWGSRLTVLLLPDPGPEKLLDLFLIAVVLAAFGWFILRKHRLPSQEDAVPRSVWLQASVAPIVASTMLLIGWFRSGGYPTWVLKGDMIWNTYQSLFIHADGGVGFGERSNSAALTNLLFAVGYGPLPDPSLGHIFQVHAWVLLAIGVVTSFVSGSFTALRAKGLNPFVGSLLTFIVGWLPFTGVLFFQISEAGHANTFVSYMLLWLSVLIYGERTMAPKTRIALLLALTVVIAASWAPLVVFPVSLASVLFVLVWNSPDKGGLKSWVLPILAFAQAGSYAIFITLPDFRTDQQALGNGGWQFPISLQDVIVSTTVLLSFAVVTFWLANRKHPRQSEVVLTSIGLFAALGFATPALGFLLLQCLGTDDLMGYYPVKFVSFLLVLVAGLLITQVAALIPRSGKALTQLLIAVLCALPLIWAGVMVPSFTRSFDQMTMAPTAIVSRAPLTAEQIQGMNRLVKIFDSNRKGANLVLDSDEWVQELSNNYLIQLSVEKSSDPVRHFFMANQRPWDDEDLCDVVRIWNRDVVVYTSPDEVAQTEARFADCPVRDRVSLVAHPGN